MNRVETQGSQGMDTPHRLLLHLGWTTLSSELDIGQFSTKALNNLLIVAGKPSSFR